MRLVVSIALLLGLGCAERSEAILTLHGDADSGAPIYAESCASCHGESGEGDVGPDLSVVVPEHDDHQMMSLLLEGIGDDMPSFEHHTDQELAHLVAHLRHTHGEYQGHGHDDEH
ncbi:MAG: c-type cytochrome [Alphaproteobacteria bacterium]|nr:c-type cytochrome [Alphaproteobacteria bacterium]